MHAYKNCVYIYTVCLYAYKCVYNYVNNRKYKYNKNGKTK